jgi:hypothetical protein
LEYDVLVVSLSSVLLQTLQAVKEGKIAFELAHGGMDVYEVRGGVSTVADGSKSAVAGGRQLLR